MKKRRRGGGLRPLPLRKLALWAAGVATVLILLLVVGYAQLLSYLQGERFRDQLARTLANKAHAESVELDSTLHIDANRVSLRGATLTRPGILHQLSARGIHTELRRAALFNRELHLTRLTVEESTLTLTTESGSKTLPTAGKATGNFLSGVTPVSARLDRATCNRFNTALRFGGKDYALTGSSLEVVPAPRQGKKAWEFRLNNGRLHTPLPILGDCSLKSATLIWGGKVNSLTDARLILSPGELIVSAMHEPASGIWSADLRVNKMDIARLLKDDWKKRLRGGLYGQLDMNGTTRGLSRAEGRLSLQQGVLEALPILAKLPVGNTHPYRCLKLERAEARLSYPYADADRNIRRAWLMDDIDIQGQDGLLLVKGHVIVDADGTLAGTLNIGLPANIATLLAPADSALHGSLFHTVQGSNDNYLWLRLNLSGTLDDPQEDLSVRLTTLLGDQLMQKASGLLGNLLAPGGALPPSGTPAATDGEEQEEDEAKTKTQTPSATPSPTKVINEAGSAAQDIIGTGLRSIF